MVSQIDPSLQRQAACRMFALGTILVVGVGRRSFVGLSADCAFAGMVRNVPGNTGFVVGCYVLCLLG